MHDPQTQAFVIKNPFAKKSKSGYQEPLITIWHCDPEKDGSDDSCGWFVRSNHIDKKLIESIRKEFGYEFKHWFKEDGKPIFSNIGITVQMYRTALWKVFEHQGINHDRINVKRTKFLQKHLFEIIHFAENYYDSLDHSINSKFGVESTEYRVSYFTSVVTADIFRKLRKWYQHPKWHVHHWEFQIHPWQKLKRRYWDKCLICGKRGFTGSAFGLGWSSKKIAHRECFENGVTSMENTGYYAGRSDKKTN